MTVENTALLNIDLMPRHHTHSDHPRRPHSMAEMKARQSAKIREIAEALVSAGFVTLDAQADALGLCRSTTWTILKGNHKSTGLSAKVINRILAHQLPPLVRAKILEYVEEKASGRFGHSANMRRTFIAALSAKRVEQAAEARIVKATRPAREARNVGSAYKRPSSPAHDTSRPDDFTGQLQRSRRAL